LFISKASQLHYFEIFTTCLDNESLQKRITMLEDDVEEKTNQILQITNQNEEATKEFADSEQQLRTEFITQGRLIDLLKEQLDVTKGQNASLKESITQTKVFYFFYKYVKHT
jgi:predicted RNase H-like nuclease (RuvC/YqgF family)